MKTKNGIPYAVSFKTAEVPGRITALTVGLDWQHFGLDARFRVDLTSHPLYPHLQEYGLNNPVPRLKS